MFSEIRYLKYQSSDIMVIGELAALFPGQKFSRYICCCWRNCGPIYLTFDFSEKHYSWILFSRVPWGLVKDTRELLWFEEQPFNICKVYDPLMARSLLRIPLLAHISLHLPVSLTRAWSHVMPLGPRGVSIIFNDSGGARDVTPT